MNELLKYRISFVVRDKTTREIIKEKILDDGRTEKRQVLSLFFKYPKMFKEKTPENVEKLKNPEWDYSLEIMNENKILSQAPVFQKVQHL